MTPGEIAKLIGRLHDKAFQFSGDPILEEAADALEQLSSPVPPEEVADLVETLTSDCPAHAPKPTADKPTGWHCKHFAYLPASRECGPCAIEAMPAYEPARKAVCTLCGGSGLASYPDVLCDMCNGTGE
jgi:hypothetical protein